MSSTSFAEDLAAYVTTRLAVGRIVLLWLSASACALALSRASQVSAILAAGLLMGVLIAQFRLWDDLADRRYDAGRRPDRVIVRSDHGRAFAALCAALSLPVAASLWMLFGAERVGVYAGLLAAVAMLYGGGAALPRLFRSHLVLLKYPVFIWLCARGADASATLRIGAAAYLALSVFEVADDVALRRGTAWRWLVGTEAALLLLLVLGAWT